MPRVIIIGGGFAGLSAAVDLADRGIGVTLIEARSSLGGRARSFTDPSTKEVIDNGQHLFLFGYHETRRFLSRLGTSDKLVFQKNLQVAFARPPGKSLRFSCPPLPSPWHFVAGLARFSGLSFSDKWRLKKIWRVAVNGNSSDAETVETWLQNLGQSRRARENFWHPLAIATLNEDPSRASAFGLAAVLKTLIGGKAEDACLGIPVVGLSALYAEEAQRVIEEAGGKVLLNSPVDSLTFQGSTLQSVRLANGEMVVLDAAVAAVPPGVLSRIVPAAFREKDLNFSTLSRFATSPIISVNLWLDRPVTDELFVGMVGTRFQWLFNKPAIFKKAGLEARYLCLILSAARPFIDQTNEALITYALEDLRACFPRAGKAKLIRSQVVRERDATVSLTCGMERHRPDTKTLSSNFFLAGDWIKTGLPATIESAVISGRKAAQAVLQYLEHSSLKS